MLKKYLLLLAFLVSLSFAQNVTTYTYKTVGDVKVQLDVYTPPSKAPLTGYPIFFSIHGGGFVSSNRGDIVTPQELAEIMKRGWVLVCIDYRLMPGVFLQDIMDDVKDAIAWVRTELPKKTPVNPELITVFGQSAGGGLATMCGYLVTPRPQAIIGFYSGRPNWTDPSTYDPSIPVTEEVAGLIKSLSDPVISWDVSEIEGNPRIEAYFKIKANRKMGWMAVTHDPNYPAEKIIKKLKELSSAENVDRNFPPTYLGHGLVDTIVPYNQSVQLANQLEKNGVHYKLDLIPGADHIFDDDSTLWEKHILPAFDFAAPYMKPKVDETSRKFLEKFIMNLY